MVQIPVKNPFGSASRIRQTPKPNRLLLVPHPTHPKTLNHPGDKQINKVKNITSLAEAVTSVEL